MDAAAVGMVVENTEPALVPCGESAANGGETNQKRPREEVKKERVSKKPKVDEEEEEEKKKSSGPVKLGFKTFGSSLELFDYFYGLLHAWPPSLNVNKVFPPL